MTDLGDVLGRRGAPGQVRTFLAGRRPAGVAFQAFSALVSGLGIAWVFYGQREVMDLGGSCASGGPYVNAVECPDGAWMLGLAIPVMTLTVILATIVAAGSATPLPVLPMWAVLFTSLGANFLDYGIDPGSASWIVCGVVFELMALPAWLVIGRGLFPSATDEPGELGIRVLWTAIYLALGLAGWVLGWWSYRAWS